MGLARDIFIQGILKGGGVLFLFLPCFFVGLDLYEYFSRRGPNAGLFGPSSWMAMFLEEFFATLLMCVAGGALIGLLAHLKNSTVRNS